MYNICVQQPASQAIVRRSARSIPRCRADFLPFTSKIVEHSRYLPMVASTQIGLHFNTMPPTNGTLTEVATPSCRSAAWPASRFCRALNGVKKQRGFLPDLPNRIMLSNPVELPSLIVVLWWLQLDLSPRNLTVVMFYPPLSGG